MTLKDLIRLAPSKGYAYHKMAILFIELNKPEDALTFCKKAIKYDSQMLDAYQARVSAYEALEGNKILLHDAYVSLGKALLQREEFREVISIVDKAIKDNPNDSILPYQLKVEAIINLGQDKKYLIDQLEEVIIAKPEIMKFCVQKLQDIENTGLHITSESYIIKGLVFYYLGNYNASIEAYEEAIYKLKEYIEHGAPDYTTLADAYNNKGNALCALSNENKKKGKNIDYNQEQEALKCYDEAIKFQPNNKLYYCNRGKLLNDMGRPKEALQDFEQAQSLSSNLNLRKDNEDYIKVILEQDKLLLQRAIELQKNTLILEEQVESLPATENNISLLKKIETFKQNSKEIVNKTISNASGEEVEALKKQLQELKQEFSSIRQELSSKVDAGRLESHAFKVSEEILSNIDLKCYYDALSNKLYSVFEEAAVIAGGHLALNTFSAGNIVAGVSSTVPSEAISNIAPCLLSVFSTLTLLGCRYVVEPVASLKMSNSIKEQATKIQRAISLNPDERKSILKEIAEKITLNKKELIEDIEHNQEVLNWENQGFVKSCINYFILNMDKETYRHKIEILGYIDALKIIEIIIKDDKIDTNEGIVDLLVNATKMDMDIPSNSSDETVLLVNQIKYDNPILNKSSLLQELSKFTGLSLYKVLANSNILMQAGYENIITQAVNNHDVAKLGDLLVGIDYD